jgi:hypothetical protein
MLKIVINVTPPSNVEQLEERPDISSICFMQTSAAPTVADVVSFGRALVAS